MRNLHFRAILVSVGNHVLSSASQKGGRIHPQEPQSQQSDAHRGEGGSVRLKPAGTGPKSTLCTDGKFDPRAKDK